METTEPSGDGFTAEFTEPSSFRAAIWPLPNWELVNTAGAVEATGTGSGVDWLTPFDTMIWVLGPATWNGTTG